MKVLILTIFLSTCLRQGESAQPVVVDFGPLLTFKDIDTWEASDETQRNYGYYVAGVDKEGRPVFVSEVGRWNFKKAVEDGGYEYEQMRRQIAKALWRSVQAVNGNYDKVVTGVNIPNANEFPDGVVWIFDAEGFEYSQIASINTLFFFFEVGKTFSKLTDTIAHVQIINTNFVVENLLNFMKPGLGEFSERIEIAGANKERGNQMLLKRIQKNQLPEWYGGVKEFKPVAVYG